MINFLILTLLHITAAANDGSVIVFTLALPQNNIDLLKQRVGDISNYKHVNYGKFMTINEIKTLVSPPIYQSTYIVDYLSSKNIKCRNFGDSLTCVGDQETVFNLFSVNNDKYILPPEIDRYVDFVEGLGSVINNDYTSKTDVRVTNDVDPGFVGTESLRKLYNIPDVYVNCSLVSVEYLNQSGYSNLDLVMSQYENGLVGNKIGANHSIGANIYQDTETALDIQMESQLSKGAELWYWGGSKWLFNWAVTFFNTPVVPYVASHSWGWAIDQQCTIMPYCNGTDQQYINRVNNEYVKIAARGVTMVVASGDAGAPGRTDEGCSSINRTVNSVFPGSSPYVLSVGATFVVKDTVNPGTNNWTTPLCQKTQCSTGTKEAFVNFNNVSWTAGGGFGTNNESAPVWQNKAILGYFAQNPPLPTHYNPLGRAYPDISVIGHNCPIWQVGMVGAVDGTSCSSPTMASIVALLNSHQLSKGKPLLGLVAPVLYEMYYDKPEIFNDIVSGYNWCTEEMCCPTRADGGSDYGYVSAKGFDPVTGLGTPNVREMISWLDSNVK